MKKGWEIKKLGEVCEVLDKLRKPITKRDRITGEFPYYGATGILDYINDFIFDEKLILIGEDGAKWSSGDRSSFIVESKYWVNNHAHVIKPNRSIIIDEWIVNYLNYSDLSEYVSGMTVPKLNQGNLRNIEIPLPPLPEQKSIVSILDKAFSAIERSRNNAEQNLKNTKELFESVLNGEFSMANGKLKEGWEEKRFDEVCVLQRGFDLPTRLRNEGDYPLVSSNGATDMVDVWKVKAPGVVTGRSGTIGKVHFIEKDFWPLNTALYIKEFHGNYEECIFYFLKQFDLSKCQSGAGVPTLNRNNVHSLKVWFPKSKEQQKQIVEKLNTISAETKNLENIYQQKLKDLEELKKSVLQKAFNGEL